VRAFQAWVTYRDSAGLEHEEGFPISTVDSQSARDLALAYVLQALKLKDFELRVVGA
jgi:hypothetical protein